MELWQKRKLHDLWHLISKPLGSHRGSRRKVLRSTSDDFWGRQRYHQLLSFLLLYSWRTTTIYYITTFIFFFSLKACETAKVLLGWYITFSLRRCFLKQHYYNVCICLILALYSKKYGRILSSSASMAFNGSVGGYLKLPLELHAKVILLLEIGHIVSKPLLVLVRLSLILFLG